MRTTDLFKNQRSADRINESIEKTFGKRLNLESFDLPKLEDARNKLRTQIHNARSQSGFNETLENEALTQAQWMLDAINAEIAERDEFVVDAGPVEVEEGFGSLEEKVQELLQKFEQAAMEIGGYGDPDIKEIVKHLENGDAESAAEVVWYAYADQDGGEFPEKEPLIDDLQAEFEELVDGGDQDPDEGGETDDAYALASAGFGSDEDYESLDNEAYDMDQLRKDAADRLKASLDKQSDDRIAKLKSDREKEDEPFMAQVGRKIVGGVKGAVKGAARGFSGKEGTEVSEKAPPGDKAERMVKHIKKGYAKDGKLSDKERGIAYATAWKQHNKEKNESTESGEDMTKLQEGEIQQASAIVTAKTMVDRVGRWIEELSGMENDTLLQLGDSIRDEMGAEQAKNFISACAPAIQAALENLKATRETLSTGVRQLTGEEQAAGMLGAEPEADLGSDLEAPAEPDAMNAEPADDEFAAAEPAAGGLGDSGREQRESIDYQNRLLKVLAG